MSNVANVTEVVAAQAFLKAIGANYQSTDLLYSVVAWMRTSEGGKANLWGNNPFNLRATASTYISKDLISGTKYRVGYGKLLVFDSLTAGLKAMAQYLVHRGGYGLILRSFKAGSSVDSLTAIALSAWDANHYGYNRSDPDPANALKGTSLYRVYMSFTGLQLPTPKQPKPAEPKPKPPRDLPSPPLAHPYIDPGEAKRFYHHRHRRDTFLE